ncbi:hypothetical protein RT21_19070 [Pseudomonas sp. 10B238]|jgi:hypothetical protein|uniref:SnoaL-like domain-containing protein n=1 Tax=Stutzerimonas stutzeri TaxID=316 RepID=A0A172WPQ4_STUST|nr:MULTISPECIES: hypothetical protein [Pseudomonadaceae]AZZ45433.1 hypothetical protein C1896_11300 [Pseudomonadaceae bacterium SI-3]MCH2341591.1 hypothetical protein [Pseudomonas sp.]BAP81483.1 hypothetical protein MT1_4310 [Pseudomonas sp. MT-1]ANF25481.1 hypothetical protein PS273GM_10135 [Stutzerimonas stutzeri]KJJ61582.1 hypothetical protein RT21_19070 [Pseudomonas sp. 10B238]|tara:strand:+ start:2255 stop:2662 length:408 start_codon:yes stop_codon:yes gene_type:complete
MNIKALPMTLFLLASAGLAQAGTAEDDARLHIRAIAENDLPALLGQYAPYAHLSWKGGPLQGSYDGTDSIEKVWQKFVEGQGPLSANIEELVEKASVDETTVSARVLYKGQKELQVIQTMTYRKGQLADEVWAVK